MVDEPGKNKDSSVATAQDSSKDNQDTSQGTATSSDKSVQDQISDALAAAGRDAKALEARKEALDKRESDILEQQTKAREEQRKREREAAEGEELDLVTRRHQLEDKEDAHAKAVADFNAEKNKYDDELSKYRETQLTGHMTIAANKNGIEFTDLKQTAEKLGITDYGAIDELAKSLGKGKQTTEPHVDSNRMSGSGTSTASTPDAKIARGLAKKKK